jgi:hypothetical protein
MSNLSLGSYCSKGESSTHLSPLLKGEMKKWLSVFLRKFFEVESNVANKHWQNKS